MNQEWKLRALSWAEAEDYTEGLHLWKERFGENITFKALCMGPNDFNRVKLRDGLMKGVEPDQAPAALAQPTSPPPTDKPADIVAWEDRAGELMDERVLLKQRLRELPDPDRREERKRTAFRIVAITDELDELYGKIGYWEEFGRVPAGPPAEEEKQVLPQSYLNLRTYVSRTEKKLRKETDPVRIKELEAKLSAWRMQMREMENQIASYEPAD